MQFCISLACLSYSMHPAAKPQIVSLLLWTKVIKKALQLLPADAQDKALVFQADANTSLLDAIRQVSAICTCNTLCVRRLHKRCQLTHLDVLSAAHNAAEHKGLTRPVLLAGTCF